MRRDTEAAEVWRQAIRRAADGTGVRITAWTSRIASAERMATLSAGLIGASAIMDPVTGLLWFVADSSKADGPDVAP